MNCVRFEQILTQINYTDEETKHYVDSLFHTRNFVEAYNSNMSTNFIQGWVFCLDESTMIWTKKFVPGWVGLPRNPYPSGNKWHSICCEISVVVFFVELAKGED